MVENRPASTNRAARDLGRRLRPAIVAIDGPAASGKSTVGYLLAQLLDYLFFDTGVMYRAVTWAALDRGVTIGDEASVSRLAREVDIDLAAPHAEQNDGRHCTVLLDGIDITWKVRKPEVDRHVSSVSAYPEVRAALTVQQRRIARRYGSGEADRPGVIMVGRDIGTVVVPDAPIKIYMDASAEERARRRHRELAARGKPVEYAMVLADIQHRDAVDSQRDVAPLRAANDAVIVDTTTLTPDEVAARVVGLIGERVTGDR
jgi:CMP/dCMP kinase